MRIGFVGLGVMGLPMVRNLLRGGHEVTVSSRSQPPVQAAVAEGAVDGRDPEGVAGASDVVFLCLPSSPDSTSVVQSMLPALGANHVVVDCSTIAPTVARELHDRVARVGASYLDAPVSGGSIGARDGTLVVMVGGDAAGLERARPALECVSSLVVHCGDAGMGQVVKLCNNLVYAAQMQATAEAFTLAAKAGVDLQKAHQVLTHGTGDCTAVRTRVPFEGVVSAAPASNGWAPGFMTDLMHKDIGLALDFGESTGVRLRSAELALELLARARAAGHGRLDFSSVGLVLRADAGV